MKQSNYHTMLDVDLYTSILKLVDRQDVYGIAITEYPVALTLNEFYDCINNFAAQSTKRRRAIALAIASSDFESLELADKCLELAVDDNDVFLKAAYCKMSNAEESVKYPLLGSLMHTEYSCLEEAAIAMLSVDPKAPFGADDLLMQVFKYLKGNLDFIILNTRCFQKMLDWNEESCLRLQILTMFGKAIDTAPNEDSSIVTELLENFFKISDVWMIIWWMRSHDEKYSRGYRRTERIKKALKTELAQYFKTWSDLEHQIIQEFGGDLGCRIYSRVNYTWYYENFGFHLPELKVNLKDKRASITKVAILSDYEKCKLAMDSNLEFKKAAFLNIKFSEWRVDIQEYFDKSGVENPEDRRFLARNLPVEECTPRELAVKILLDAGDESWETLEVARQVAEFSVIAFARVVNDLECEDDLTEEELELYENVYYSSFEDCGIEEFKTMMNRDDEAIQREYLEQLGYNEEVECGYTIGELYKMIVATDEDKAEVLKCILSSGLNIYSVEKFVKCRCVLSSMRQYVSYKKQYDKDTDAAYLIANTKAGRDFREFTKLSITQCFSSLDLTVNLIQSYKNGEYNARQTYEVVMPQVLHDWVTTGSPVKTFNSKFPIGAGLHLTGEQITEWLNHVTKKPEDSGKLSTMSLNVGYFDNDFCILTSIGILNMTGTYAGDINLPVWILDEESEYQSITLTNLCMGAALQVDGLPTIFCDTQLQLRLKRIN